VVEADLFGGPYRTIVARIYDFIDKYKKPPKDHLADILSDKLESKNVREAELYTDIIQSIHAAQVGINSEYVMAQLETFVKRQSLRGIAVELAKALQRDTEESLEEAEGLLSKANKQTLGIFDPGTRLSDKKRALGFLDNSTVALPTGIPELDKRGFGPTRKEMWLYIANTKAGKCIAEGEQVLLADGSYVPIQNIDMVGVSVASLNEDTMRFEAKPARLAFNGIKNVVKVTTRTGRTVTLTDNHPLLTKSGWKLTSEVRVGEAIAAPIELPFFGNEEFPREQLRLLGYLIADGGLTKASTPTFTKHDHEVVADFIRCAETVGCTLTPSKKVFGEYWVTSHGKENNIVNLLKTNELIGKKSNAKVIPDFIFRLKKKLIAEFLSALFTCDGSIFDKKTGACFEYGTTSKVLARQVDHLLTRFGLVSKVRERWQIVAGKPYCSWTVSIKGKRQIVKFDDDIGLFFGKQRKLNTLIRKHGLSGARTNYTCNDRVGSIFYDKVVSIEKAGRVRTYDLSVERTHNFIAGNLVVHNTWALIHLAKMALIHRVRVCHITLEMSEARCAQRYLQAFFAISKRKESFQTIHFEKDKLDRISGFADVRVTPTLSFDDPNIKAKLAKKIDKAGTRWLDNIYIKQFPTGSLTVNQLEAYLDNLEQTERFIPDLLIIDYPDLMKLDAANFRLAIDDTYKRIRGLLVSRNIAGAVVSQSHRSAAKSKLVGSDNVAEAYSKIAHADTVITYTQTKAEHKLGLARLHVAGGRNDEDKITICISQQYGIGAYMVDSTLMNGVYWENLPAGDEGDN
jgi:hypothetical protein